MRRVGAVSKPDWSDRHSDHESRELERICHDHLPAEAREAFDTLKKLG
jgi:hypothetical protein